MLDRAAINLDASMTIIKGYSRNDKEQVGKNS